MNYTLENKYLTITVSSLGAELKSIKSNMDQTEYLWQGDEAYWHGQAPTLFPICGRLFNNTYSYKEKEYSMNIHGFARKMEWEKCNMGQDYITFSLKNTEETLKLFPFQFCIFLTYTLNENNIQLSYLVENTGDEPLYFQLGYHPGFNVPLLKQEAFEDYYLEFPFESSPKRVVFSDTGLFTSKFTEYPLKNNIISLDHSLFNHDAIFLKDVPNEISLKNNKNNKSITIAYPNMTYLGIWHTPNKEAPFVCLEPWSGLPGSDGVVDEFQNKIGVLSLVKNKKYSNTITIQVQE